MTGTSVKSQLHSVPGCQSIGKKAIIERLAETYAVSEFPETGAEFVVKLTLLKDRVTVTLDTSGAGLHKRGYRVKNVPAPIKETLAAGLLYLSVWRKDKSGKRYPGHERQRCSEGHGCRRDPVWPGGE